MLTAISVELVCLLIITVKGNIGAYGNETQSEIKNITISTDQYTASPDLPSWVGRVTY